jgi:CRISPR-associated endonuclease/helicase Cas3
MADAADVGRRLFEEWLPRSTTALLAGEFGGDVDDTRAAVRFLAGAHDLGKVTPAFAVQSEALAERMRSHGLWMPSKNQLPDRALAHHSLAGQQLLQRWLTDHGWPARSARTWGIVLGGHHGAPPDADAEQITPEIEPELYGSGLWHEVQDEFAAWITERTGATERLATWQELRLSQPFQVLATGLVIVADWIASNTELFAYHAEVLPVPTEYPRRVRRAMSMLHLPGPWALPEPVPDIGELFSRRFALPAGAAPRPVQREVVTAARAMTEPGLLTVEAPMGEGKTEAALAGAEELARTFGAGGLLVALPTQATTDAMFSRVLDWLDALGAEQASVAGAITLSHGKARLNRVFAGLLGAGRMRDIDADAAGRHWVLAHSWLSGRKKAALANFGIGTIDQLLFAGLKAKHLMLRHLGLAGKVVVIDEVHAYDAFMNSYLTAVLTWLGAYRVPVIALSATLPPDRRAELLRAYQEGTAQGAPRAEPTERGYPLVSWTGSGGGARVAEASGRGTTVHIDALGDDPEALATLLRERLAGGGNALVVRNTVRRVLETADRLEREFPGEVTLAHARFLAVDRMRNDESLLDRFGPPGRATERPWRQIVVASQVVEQSLDVDFDLLVTDLAPADLVLQRMGRLHRHERAGRPAAVREARVWLTGADLTCSPPELEPAARDHVYGAYPLLRAAAVFTPRLGDTVELPGDIAPLVHAAYGSEPVAPPEWGEAMAEAERKWRRHIEGQRERASVFGVQPPKRAGKPISGWVAADVGETDDEAQGQGQVREGAPSLEALVVQCDETGAWRTPGWLTGAAAKMSVPSDRVPPDELAEVMATCVVRLPLELSEASYEEALWDGTPDAWEDSPVIYRIPALPLGPNGEGEIAGKRVRYTPERGLEVFRGDD